MPFEEAGKAWKAYNAGVETWKTYLIEIESQLTRSAFENLCRVVPLDRETLVLHDLARPRLVSLDDDQPSDTPETVAEVVTETERRLRAALRAVAEGKAVILRPGKRPVLPRKP